jgi:hypothetical protein
VEIPGMSTYIETLPSQQKYKANQNTSRHKLQPRGKTKANYQQKSHKDLMQRGPNNLIKTHTSHTKVHEKKNMMNEPKPK